MNKKALIAGALLVPALALGQSPFDFGGGAGAGKSKPWDELVKNPKTTVKLSFRNAGIDSIISLFEKTSGITIIKDPSLVGGLTVTSAKAVPLSQAFQILSTTLSLKGYELAKDENLLVIRKKDQNRGGWGGMGGNNGFDLSQMMGNQQESKIEVYPISYANASQIARAINEVFAAAGGMQFPGFGGMPGGGGFGGNNRFNGRGGGGFNPAAMAGMFGRNQGQSNVRASADDFSNSVIVNAPSEYQTQVKALINKLDKQTEEPQKSRVFPLQYAVSDELQSVIQNVLTANVPRGRGGASTQSGQGPQAFLQALRGNVAGSGTVVSDPRTNSLVVTATQENLETVDKVIKELDTEVKYEPSTFVFPLSNARASDVATLMQQAFGQRQGVNGGGFGGNRNNTGNFGGNRTNNRNNRNNNRGGGGFGGELIDPDTLQASMIPVDLQDPNADSGQLMTNVAVAQGFGGGGFFGGQQRRNTNTQSQVGRNSNGQLVNVRDLTGQVTAIPDPNTNSIIVVTSPENADLLRNILDQLDRIPEQVMIETIIVEATLDSTSRLGVEWKFANERLFNSNTAGVGGTDFGQQTSPPQTGFRYTLTGPNLNAFINAFKSDNKFQVLSTPRIFTSNNTEAEINISQSVPYVTSSRQDNNGNFTFNYSFQDVGIVLTVTPRITSNGYVTMDVVQTANDLQGYTDFNAPIINQRTAQTTVSVRDSETIVLGGIIRSTVNVTTRKVPILGDIPILGSLFKSTSKENQKTELLVFLTPHVVRDPDEAAKLRENQEKQMSPSSQKSLDEIIKALPKSEKAPVKSNGGAPKKGDL